MKAWTTLVAIALTSAAIAAQPTIDQCKAHLDAEIKKIDKEMNRGYREPRGNQLRAKRKKLSDLRYECNDNPAAWRKAAKL